MKSRYSQNCVPSVLPPVSFDSSNFVQLVRTHLTTVSFPIPHWSLKENLTQGTTSLFRDLLSSGTLPPHLSGQRLARISSTCRVNLECDTDLNLILRKQDSQAFVPGGVALFQDTTGWTEYRMPWPLWPSFLCVVISFHCPPDTT